MIDARTTWNEVRRLADELAVNVHLAGLDARDQWRELEPRVERLEESMVHSTGRAGDEVLRELVEVREELRALRERLYLRMRGDYVRG